LTPGAFDLDATPACAFLGASQTKNRRPVQQPLPADVAAALRDYLADKPVDLPIWPGTWHERAAAMLRLDLDAAGIPYAVAGPDGPQFADFHSLRHAFVSMLDRAGATLKQAMQLARHSDPKLTMKRYGRAHLGDLAGAVDKLPSLLPTDSATEGARATGTDDFQPARLARALHSPMPKHAGGCGRGMKSSRPLTAGCHKRSTAEKTGHDDDCGTPRTAENLVPPPGFEPGTSGLGNRCSIP
jgi:hypothetical protein